MMLVLDTNVISETMSPEPAPQVAMWMSAQPLESLYTVAVCQAEILAGIAVLPEGRRRRALEAAARAVFTRDFEGRVLPFEERAAAAYAGIFADRRQAGRPIEPIDLMIAAVARAHGARMVTRDISGFEGCGLTLVNPWESP
jgi:predicted nucleic acid-binding protein